MKKILIISYFFPPCSLTASQRPYSWYVHLHKFGIYPIVVTRKWEKEIKIFADANQLSSEGIEKEIHDWGEIHRLPYQGNIRDKMLSKYGSHKYTLVRKILSFAELILQHFIQNVIPYKNIYSYSLGITRKNNISGIIISGGPFPQFLFGYLLKKRTQTPWIADYRDDWSTDEVNITKGLLHKLLNTVNRYSEKKWVKSASTFTTISPYYQKKISNLVQISGHVIQNGFSEFQKKENIPNLPVLIYNGTLYPTQPVELFLEALHHTPDISVSFIGLAVDDAQEKRVKDYAKKLRLENRINVTSRIPKQDVMDMQSSSTALVMIGHKGLKGIPSSKIYEYLSLGKPIILFEPDNDILEEIVSGYNLGFIIKKVSDLPHIIRKIEGNNIQPDWEYIAQFSREKQTFLLAELCHKYFGTR